MRRKAVISLLCQFFFSYHPAPNLLLAKSSLRMLRRESYQFNHDPYSPYSKPDSYTFTRAGFTFYKVNVGNQDVQVHDLHKNIFAPPEEVNIKRKVQPSAGGASCLTFEKNIKHFPKVYELLST